MIAVWAMVLHLSYLPMRVSRYGRYSCALLVVFLSLTGCSVKLPDPPKPPPRFAAAAQLVPPDRMFTLSDGAAIPARVWKAQGQPRGILLALHGFNDSRDAWEQPAPFFAGQGITVVAPDQRGFGEAPKRGEWAGSDRMVQDVREEIAILQQENPQTPLYLTGESMGGAILMLLMSAADAPLVAGTLLLAPAVWNLGLGADIPLDVLATLFPHHLVTGRELPVHVVASDNPAALLRLYFDPLTLRATQLEALRGLVSLMKQAAAAAPQIKGPLLCVYGDKDQLVPSKAMAKVWETLPKGTRLDLISGGHHLLLRDKNGKQVMQDMLTWITQPDSFLPSGGDVAASTWQAQNPAKPEGKWFPASWFDGLAR